MLEIEEEEEEEEFIIDNNVNELDNIPGEIFRNIDEDVK